MPMTELKQAPLSAADTGLGRRDIVLGCNSAVWLKLSVDARIAKRVVHAIGHRDMAAFEFTANDRLWVFSYSRREGENSALLARLREAGVAEIIYLSSSSTCVAAKTSCYEYPRVKRQADLLVEEMPNGRVLTVGLIYGAEEELPAGENAATSIRELADFMLTPNWPAGNGKRKNLLRAIKRPFSNRLEEILYRGYGAAIMAAGRYPCLLRPIDLILRSLGMRWYGYVYLSNRVWISTIS
jgi:hypothetical protein